METWRSKACLRRLALAILAALAAALLAGHAPPEMQWLFEGTISVLCVAALLWLHRPNEALGAFHLGVSAAVGVLAAAVVALGEDELGARALSGALLGATVSALALSETRRAQVVKRVLVAHLDRSGEGWVVSDRRGAVVAANELARRILFPDLDLENETVAGKLVPEFLLRALRDPSSRTFPLNLGDQRFFEITVSEAAARGPTRDLRSAVLHEITGLRNQEQRLRRMAHYDTLTGLSNRRRFLEYLESRVTKHQDDHQSDLALLYADLDSFKAINDELGHGAGDQCLRTMAERFVTLTRGARPGTPSEALGRVRAFRLAGDEFALVAEGIPDREAASHLAHALIDMGREPIQYSDHTFSTTLSVGIALCPNDGADTETLMQRADAAMYAAKRHGKDRFEFYDASFQSSEDRVKRIERGLRAAIDAGEIELHYQPKVDASTRTLVGFEALTRWNSSELGKVGPAEFIPVAERSGLIAELGTWCLRETCRQLRVWSDRGYDVVPISVNVSSMQFTHGDLRYIATEALREYAVEPTFLELELTESLILRQDDDTLLALRDLRAIGLRVSLDDFGSGYSALTYLGRFPLDILKLDYGFVRDIENNDAAAGIVEAVISMARTLGLSVVAEGVESLEQAELLARMGCDHLQGFLFSPAVPHEKAEGLLAHAGEAPKPLAAQEPSLSNFDDTHGAVSTATPVSRVAVAVPEENCVKVEARVLLIDDAQGSLGETALRLTRLGFDLHYAPAIDEATFFIADKRDSLRLLICPPNADLAAVSCVRSRLTRDRRDPIPLAVMGDAPDPDRRTAIREAGATWVLWAPFEDGELSFLLHAAVESSVVAGHRAEQRVPVSENAWVRVGPIRRVGVLTTLSIGGCFVEMENPPEPGTWMRLEFELPDVPVRVFGEVLYRRSEQSARGCLNDGVGIHFKDLDKESEEAIRTLVDTIAARYTP